MLFKSPLWLSHYNLLKINSEIILIIASYIAVLVFHKVSVNWDKSLTKFQILLHNYGWRIKYSLNSTIKGCLLVKQSKEILFSEHKISLTNLEWECFLGLNMYRPCFKIYYLLHNGRSDLSWIKDEYLRQGKGAEAISPWCSGSQVADALLGLTALASRAW